MKHAEHTITDLENRLKDINKEAVRIKTAINCLYEVMGKPPKYDEVVEKSDKGLPTRSDEYYGKPLATGITAVLEKRKAIGLGAAKLDEIYEELIAGGCKLTGKNEAIEKRGLAISMSKNPKFHRLPNDTWGLTEWYPGVKESKKEHGEQVDDENINQQKNSGIG